MGRIIFLFLLRSGKFGLRQNRASYIEGTTIIDVSRGRQHNIAVAEIFHDQVSRV